MPPEDGRPQASHRRPRATRARRALRVMAGLAAGWILALLLLERPWRTDARLDDSDLILPPRPPLDPASNAVVLLERAAARIQTAPEGMDDAFRDLNSTNPTPAGIPALLAAERDALDALWLAAAAPGAVVEQPLRRSDLSGLPDPDPWRFLGNLGQAALRHDLESGRAADALEHALALARLSHRLESAGGSAPDTARGRAFRERALRELQRNAGRLPPDHPALARTAAALLDLGVNRTGFERLVRFEYRDGVDYFTAVKSGRPPGFTNRVAIPLPSLLVDLPRAKRREAALARFVLAHADTPLTRVPFDGLQVWRVTNGPLRRLLRGDALGGILGEFQVDAAERLLTDRATVEARVRLTALLLALRAHQARGRDLPPALDVLVPDPLPAVPADPFDGEPLRYDRERRILWSIGRDRVDDRGRRRGKDPAATFDLVVDLPPPVE